jgi:hypothetical protein
MGELSTYDLREIERALAEDDGTAELGIRLSVHGGRLFVRGDVASEGRRRAVLDRVAGQCPGTDVVDELTTSAEALGHGPDHREEIA